MASVTPPRKGDYTPQQLLEHDGRDPSKAILLSLFKSVYDVTAGASFYGPPSGPYSIFAGHDCTVALAKMQIDASLLDSDSSGLSFSELDIAYDWERKFQSKYPVLGKLVAESKEPDASGAAATE